MQTEGLYKNWLRGLVEEPDLSFNTFFELAWATAYEFFVPNDDNRATDGIDLRIRFERESSVVLPDLEECRLLEFFIALAIRMNETVYNNEDPDRVCDWFWELMENIGADAHKQNLSVLAIIFRRLNRREYHDDGTNGGLFPLENPRKDQRDVEIWYQMMAYLMENRI